MTSKNRTAKSASNCTFKFNLGQRVKLIESFEEGTVTARAEYANPTRQMFMIRYRAGDNRQVENWWAASDIKAA